MEVRYGKKLLKDLSGKDAPPPVFVVVGPGEADLADSMKLDKTVIGAPPAPSEAAFDKVVEKTREAATIIALGSTPAVRAARYAAMRTGARLVMAPSAITGDEVIRPLVYAHRGAGIEVEGEKENDLLLADAELIWNGPEELTRAAAGEMLSIATAVKDWERAEKGQSYSEQKAEEALELMADAMDWADEIYELTEKGIRKLVESLLAREELAKKMGTRRPVEGSEHLFVDCVLGTTGRDIPRPLLVCLGVVLMTELQGGKSKPVKQFLHWINVKWRPEDIGMSADEIKQVLLSMPGYGRERNWERTIAELDGIDKQKADNVIAGMQAQFLNSSLQERED